MAAGGSGSRDGRPERPKLSKILLQRRMAVIAGLGFSSGLPYLMTLTVLTAWLTEVGLDVKTIAFFALVGLPYTFKFLLAPLIDRYPLPFLGRRRGWILVLQLALAAAMVLMGTADPAHDLGRVAFLAVLVSFCSATQDLVVDAYNADTLGPEERAAGSAAYVFGYRIAIWITGTFALIAADYLAWSAIYASIAGLMLVGVAATLAAKEPPAPPSVPGSVLGVIRQVFVRFHARLGVRGLIVALAFAATYKFGDYFAETLRSTFLRRGVGLTWTEIALMNKILQFAGTLVGSAIAAAAVARYGVRRMLLPFGLAQALTNLLYVALAVVGKDYVMFGTAVFVDSLANAMGTGALVALFYGLTSKEVSATQYALLVALSSIGTRVFGPTAGPVQEWVGWTGYYLVSVALALPGLVLSRFLPAGAEPARQEAKAAMAAAD